MCHCLNECTVPGQVGFPHTAILGRLPGTDIYRNVKQYPEARPIPGILVVRIDAPFYLPA